MKEKTTKHNGYKIKSWFVNPLGWTYNILHKGTPVYRGAGEDDIFSDQDAAISRAKLKIDHEINAGELRRVKILIAGEDVFLTTTATNKEINALLSRYQGPEHKTQVLAYLSSRLQTGKIINHDKH